MAYTYQTQETVIVSAVRETEPSSTELFRARGIRSKREQEFNGINLTSNKEKSVDYLDSIAQEINHRSKILQHQIFEIGRLLTDAKKILPHGQFDDWLVAETQFSKSSALNFMRVYQTCIGYPEVVQFFQPSELYTIAAPQFPLKFREKLFAKALAERRPNDIGRKQLLEIMDKWKRGEVNIDSPEVQELLEIEKDRDYYYLFFAELNSLLDLLIDRRRKFERLDNKVISYPLLVDERNSRNKIFDRVIDKINCIISDVKILRDEINPDLIKKHKNCANTNVTHLTSEVRQKVLRNRARQERKSVKKFRRMSNRSQ